MHNIGPFAPCLLSISFPPSSLPTIFWMVLIDPQSLPIGKTHWSSFIFSTEHVFPLQTCFCVGFSLNEPIYCALLSMHELDIICNIPSLTNKYFMTFRYISEKQTIKFRSYWHHIGDVPRNKPMISGFQRSRSLLDQRCAVDL